MARVVGHGYKPHPEVGPGVGLGSSSSSSSSTTTAPPSSGGSSAGANSFASDVFGQLTTNDSPYSDVVRDLYDYSSQNSAFNAAQAEASRDWSHKENQLAMAHSSSEAQKNREWQEKMSNTAHQREIKDLVAAGLNPVLSSNGGASTPVGASGQGYANGGSSASADSSAASVAGLFSSMINNAAQLQMNDKNLAFQRENLEASKAIAQLQANTQLATSQNSLLGTQLSAQAQMASAGTSAEAQRYAADKNAEIQKYMNDQNASVNRRGQDVSLSGTKYTADKHYQGIEYQQLTNLDSMLPSIGLTASKGLVGVLSNLAKNRRR